MKKDTTVKPDSTRCYLCGGGEIREITGSVRDRPEMKVCRCSACGLVFLSSFDHIQAGFYENSRMHGDGTENFETWLKETTLDDERRFQFLKSNLPNRSLLDFGCGTGGFLMKASPLLATAHGVELEADLKRFHQAHGIQVFQKLSEISREIRKRGYDFITLFHVLEHLPDPEAVLRELAGWLAPQGQIVLEIPNADDALLSLFDSQPFSHFTYWSCHLFLFTSKTLERLIIKSGLKVKYIKQIQRYPLSNHLYWLAHGKPGGHRKWNFLDSPGLQSAYEKQLAGLGLCDTLVAGISKDG